MSPIEWYYARNGEQFGPVSPAELKQLALSGQLRSYEPVWREGMSDWTPARNVKGLFTDDLMPEGADAPPQEALASESPSSSGVVDQQPAAAGTPPSAARPRHPLDLVLSFAKRTITPRFIDATTLLFGQIGHYGLYFSMALVVLIAIMFSIRGADAITLPLAVVAVLTLVILQYASDHLGDSLKSLNQTVSGAISTNIFFECLALLSAFYGLIALIAMSVMAMDELSIELALRAIFVYIVFQFMAFLMINPKSLGITVDADAGATETSIGLMTMVLKLFLKLTPVAFGAGIAAETINLIPIAFSVFGERSVGLTVLSAGWLRIAVFAALPVIIYLGFIILNLVIRILESVVSLSTGIAELPTEGHRDEDSYL